MKTLKAIFKKQYGFMKQEMSANLKDFKAHYEEMAEEEIAPSKEPNFIHGTNVKEPDLTALTFLFLAIPIVALILCGEMT